MILIKLSKRHLILITIFTFILSFFIFRSQIKIRDLTQENEMLTNKNIELASFVLPECNFGHCPTYRSFSTDDDSDWESVVEVPTTMNKGAGEIWIIDEGKVVFKRATEANIGYKVPCHYKMRPNDTICNGIFISYASEYDQTGLRPSVWATEEWRYENGSYILKDTKFENAE